ncbi:MAG: hypothetical protein NVS3B12_30930 [Acidimicrobiales bacterium]
MRKIPTLYRRDPDNMRRLLREVHPDCAWVIAGEGRPTRKFDGTCVMLDGNGAWWARREVKPGRPAPDRYVPISTDPETGKTMGWEPIEQSSFAKAFRLVGHEPTSPGTYELCGPRINGNPERLAEHALVPHGLFTLADVPLDFDGLAEWLADHEYEGVVWHHPDGRMAKLKRRDFASNSGTTQ